MNKKNGSIIRHFSLLLAIIMVLTSATFAFADIESLNVIEENVSNEEVQAAPATSVLATPKLSGDVAAPVLTLAWNAIVPSGQETIKYGVRVWENHTPLDVVKYDQETYETSVSITGTIDPSKSYKYQVISFVDGEEYSWPDERTNLVIPYDKSAVISTPSISLLNSAGTRGDVWQGDDSVKINWTVPANSVFDRYELWRDNNKKIANVTGGYTDLYVPGGSHSYSIRAFYKNSDVYKSSSTSNAVSIGSFIQGDVTKNVIWKATAKKKIKLYKKGKGSKSYCKIKKGTVLSATGGKYPKKVKFWGTPKRIQVTYAGKTGWVNWSQVKVKGVVNKGDYSISKKENFVKNLSAGKGKYLIWVSRYTQRVNVFQGKKGNWKLIKVFDCCTGNYYQPAGGGMHYIKKHKSKVTKIHKNGRSYYFRYSTGYGGSGTFHTRAKWSSNNKLRNKVNRHPSTKGCVRLYDGPAKYIYNTMPIGTAVYIK